MSETIHLQPLRRGAVELLWGFIRGRLAKKLSSLVVDAGFSDMLLPCQLVVAEVCAPYVAGFNEQDELQSGTLRWRQSAGEIELFGWQEGTAYAF